MRLRFLFTEISENLGSALREFSHSLGEKDHSLTANFAPAHKLLSNQNKGFSITGDKYLSVEQSRNNVFIISPSGGGKTTTNILPSCTTIEGSAIINDPSGEISQSKAQFIAREYKVYELNFGDPTKSIYFNPMQRARTPSEVQKLAQMLVASTNEKKKDFWTNKSVELIALMINLLKCAAPAIHQNLGNVFRLLELLQGEEETINQLFAEHAPEHLWLKYKSILGNSDNTKASIISSAQASLAFIGDDPHLASLTSIDSFDFAKMRKEKIVLFLRCPLGEMNYYSTILSIFWEQFFDASLKTVPSENELDIFCLIDELASLHLPNLSKIISVSRKFLTPIMGVLQSEQQLYSNYGENDAKAILNNAGVRVYFTGLNAEAERLSNALGEYEYEDKNKSIKHRRLMTADEIRCMPKDKILIFPSNGIRPIYTSIKPYYTQSKMRKLLALNVIEDEEAQEKNIQYHIQYLDLSKYRKENQESNNQKETL